QLSEESQARNTAISQVESNAQQALSSATQSLTAELEEQKAKVDFHASAFVDRNGAAVAKGGLTTDVNGRVSGMVNTNDGSNSSLDMLADYVRLGVMENGTFKPVLQLDSQLKELILRGRLLLGDGLELKNAASIQSQVGSGLYTLTLRNGVFPSDATATSDFVTTYGRNPEKDAHLTYRNAAGTASSMKRWTGSAWSTPSMIVHGDQVTTGTMTGNRLVAGTEITTPVLKGGTGEFSGTVRAQDGSFIDKVEIGSAGGYRVFIRSVASAGYNVLEVVNSSGDVMFAVQGNGNIYSVGGGYLDNLTIGTNVDVMGRVRANQIIGDVVSAEAVSVSKTSHTSSSWRTVATVSGVNNTGHDASVVLNPFSIYAQFGLSPERDEQMRGYATYYCRVLYNGAEVSRTSARLWTETGGGSSVRYTSFMSPTYCRNASPDEAFTLTVQIYCTMSTTGRGEGDQTMNAECDTVAQVFRSGSAFN
ncbi:DUF3672 domain-containing protein, partial [Vibrio furnissii]|nr:DUF3672 domain-containing protein [Vibrio furnissii]